MALETSFFTCGVIERALGSELNSFGKFGLRGYPTRPVPSAGGDRRRNRLDWGLKADVPADAVAAELAGSPSPHAASPLFDIARTNHRAKPSSGRVA
jgi:hypothetical protein